MRLWHYRKVVIRYVINQAPDCMLKVVASIFMPLGSRVVSVLDSGTEGTGLNCSRDAVG